MALENEIRLLALKNAVEYKGKANPGSIVGKVLGTHPEWRAKTAELMKTINKIVSEVNKLGIDAQKKELEKEGPQEHKEKKERDIFAFFGIKEGEKVTSAFPPGPEKYPHIGHAKSIILNYMLAKQHNGKFILRFEDTNPTLVKKIFYDIMQENFKWLGVEWDELQYASDNMDLFYKMCEKVISEGKAYVCDCNEDQTKLSREKGIECACRNMSSEENMARWKEMHTMPEGSRTVRLKIDLQHQNTTMRDPTIFRILEQEHARLGKKYRVWPNYDFQNSIMDGYYGVTHRIRSKEFELRSELQRYIQKMLGISITTTYEFGRFNMVGVESSGRAIREKIANGELVGWDDPSLTTLVALRRRGFQPEAIKNFVVSTGISKAEATLTWDDFILHNRRLLDAESDRYFFIKDPVELWVKGAPKQTKELNLHPTHRKGGRKFDTYDTFYITKEDSDSLETGKMYRLMDCVNFRKQADGFEFDSTEVDRYKGHGEKIIHWLPKSDRLFDVEVMMPDKKVLTGLAEETAKNIKVGDVVQFERFGFCRLDEKKKEEGRDKLIFWYTHK